jgi:hypothetical protein
MEATIRGFTQRDAVSPLTRHVLGLGILLLTVVPAYLVSQANLTSPDSEAAKMAREDTADTSVEITQIVEIEAHIREVAVRYDIPPILVAAIVEAESEFNPRAVSRRGAQGLMQLMPATAASLEVEDSFDIRENLDGGVRHLRVLMNRFHNDLPLVLAAYNAGDRAVIAYRGVPPYPQTRRYVIRVLRRYDPAAARAAANRIYGPVQTVAMPPQPQVVSLDWPPPPARPAVLGPWRDVAARADVLRADVPRAEAPRTDVSRTDMSRADALRTTLSPREHGTNSP